MPDDNDNQQETDWIQEFLDIGLQAHQQFVQDDIAITNAWMRGELDAWIEQERQDAIQRVRGNDKSGGDEPAGNGPS